MFQVLAASFPLTPFQNRPKFLLAPPTGLSLPALKIESRTQISRTGNVEDQPRPAPLPMIPPAVEAGPFPGRRSRPSAMCASRTGAPGGRRAAGWSCPDFNFINVANISRPPIPFTTSLGYSKPPSRSVSRHMNPPGRKRATVLGHTAMLLLPAEKGHNQKLLSRFLL